MELTPLATLALIACAVVLIYAFVWWLTRTISRRVRAVVRSAVVLITGVALGIGLLLNFQMISRDFAIPPQGEEQQVGAEPADRDQQTATKPDASDEERTARHESEQPTWRSGRRSLPEAMPETGADPSAGDAPAMRNGMEPMATPPPADSEWDVVPVFYGTDRGRIENAERVDYGSDRGRRLQLGHALVTVPKIHQVPQIERPWVYRIPFTQIVIWEEAEDPRKHFTLKEIREVGELEFLELVRKRLAESMAYKNHALVFVHGFNTSFQFAIFRTAQIAYDLKFDGAPFLYSWPSKGQLGMQDYSYDRESAQAAEPYFRDFLKLVVNETGATSVSIIAHSMGNQLLLPVLRDLRREAPDSVRISQVILAAPDVDRDSFEFLAREIQGISNGVTLFAAANDRALAVSRQFWGGVPRAGDVPPEGPILVPGVDTIDVTNINSEMFSLNHSGYAEKTELLNDIQLLIQTGERPPEKRIPILERISTSRGDFWRYPAIR